MHRQITLFAGVVGTGLLVTMAAHGNGTNVLPYAESFEAYNPGTLLAGTNGWYGTGSPAEVVTGNPYFAWGYPIEQATHGQVLALTGPVSNLFQQGDASGAWIDFLVKPEPSAVAPLDPPDDAQTGLYLGLNGKLNVFHAYYDPVTLNPGRRWSELDHPALPTGCWFRVTLRMDYVTGIAEGGSVTDKYFQVSINGGDALGSHYGYPAIPLADPAATNGTWFLQANSGNGSGNAFIASLSTDGPGAIDDLVVTTNAPPSGAPTIYGVPKTWYAEHGYWKPDGDYDGDGSPNWAEWVAGTDAADGTSYLVLMVTDGEGTLRWTGSSITGTSATYSIFRTEDLVDGAWSTVASGIFKDISTWADPAPPPDKAYYKIAIPWEHTGE